MPIKVLTDNGIIELCLKRLFYSRVDNGVPLYIFRTKRKSYLLKKDLWKNVKPVIMLYANTQGNDIDVINNVEKMIEVVNSSDKKGDNFRYPTSYSLEYRIDNVVLDLRLEQFDEETLSLNLEYDEDTHFKHMLMAQDIEKVINEKL